MLVGGQEFYTFSDAASHERGNSQSIFLKVFIWDFREADFISLGISWDKFHHQYLD